MSVILEMNKVSKSFGNINVLKDINLKIKKGEVHALMGENGAGKSTMMKIISGIHRPTKGEVIYKGELLNVKEPRDALAKGISMIHQELSSIRYLTIAENIFLGREPKKFGLINYKMMYELTKDALDLIGIDLNPRTKMSELKVSDMQLVEIAKAISYDADIIIMDEPTSAITDREVEKLFSVIEDLKKQGKAIIYISHKMNEIFEVCNMITILRDGKIISTKNADETDNKELIKMMVGRDLDDVYPDKDNVIGEKIFSVNNLTSKDLFTDISFDLHKGEILGISGLMGAGRTEVVETIFGLHKLDSGTIEVNNNLVTINNPAQAIKHGIALVTEDRKEQGLSLPMSVKENATLASLKYIKKYGLLNKSLENKKVDSYINELNIKLSSKNQEIGQLSGGNQQKIVIAKWLMTNPKILILDEPTRGIDVGAKSEIYKLMNQFAKEGYSIIMISSELPEILGMSDRVLVFSDGRLTGKLSREEASQERIMSYATANLS